MSNGDAEMKTNWLDFFVAGVPSLEYFLIQVNHIREIADNSEMEEGHLDFTAELCVIGLAAYFEAFCKNEFAAVINICPGILETFTIKRQCNISGRTLLYILSAPKCRLGSIVAEQYDFGSAKSINGLFQDILNIAPFSKREAKKYSEFLSDRNLLVHHGGVYTLNYVEQNLASEQAKGQVHWASLVVSKNDVHRWADFLVRLATKIGNVTASALLKSPVSRGSKRSPERKKAIRALGNISNPQAITDMQQNVEL